MSQSHTIQRYSEFLSRPTSTIKEKYLTKSEVTKLINHTENAVRKLLSDPKRSVEDKSDAEKSFLGFKMSMTLGRRKRNYTQMLLCDS